MRFYGFVNGCLQTYYISPRVTKIAWLQFFWNILDVVFSHRLIFLQLPNQLHCEIIPRLIPNRMQLAQDVWPKTSVINLEARQQELTRR